MATSSRMLATLALVASCLSAADATTVEAGSVTVVSVDAPVYDTRSSAPYGCSPAGCVGANTRDGLVSTESRWSCATSLDPSATCAITYTLEDAQYIQALRIALYKGDTRTRTMDVVVDGEVILTWTSSGNTAGFDDVLLGVQGQAIELRGVLADSEWLSISEVEILVDGDDVELIEAGALATVTATAEHYDTRQGDSNGCDPEGCTAALTRDGDMFEGSRWSCATSLGDTCSISYDLGAVRDIYYVHLAMYKGSERVRTMEVYVDGALITTYTTTGTTNFFEVVYLSGTPGQVVTITGVLADSEWLSIVETEIMVDSNGVTPPPTPPVPTPSPTEYINPCLDSTSESYRCQPDPDNPNYLDLNTCNFVDSDAADFPSCFESFGITDIHSMGLAFQDDLTTLPAGIFMGLDNLNWIDISYTGLQTLPVGVFSGLSSLVELSMHWSSIEGLRPGLFDGLTNLEKLNVSSSKLTSLPAGIFDPLISLITLTLSTDTSRFDGIDIQCLPASTATDISFGWIYQDVPTVSGMCECEPAEAIYCEAGTSCQPGLEGYTCG
ncbi:unnamed protein product, partial [Scytosiphon promiscuus]